MPGGLFVCPAYTYAALGQLIRVDDGHENATWVYEYDQGGNILSKKKYALGVTTGTPLESKTFAYGNANWKDQLTAVNGVGITYDAIGNPLNDGTWQYEWVNGRQLARMYSVDTDASFVYNENGLRVQKTVNGVVTKYTLHGKNIVHMTQGSNSLHFFYDASNKPAIVEYNGTKYAYVHNLQGDIVAILDSNGSVVVQYKYDAWGKPISKTGSMASTLGTVQPFRYRGYVYDEETGLYYLRNRYYAPLLGKFINKDSILGTIGEIFAHSQFTYCKNNFINLTDDNGNSPHHPHIMTACMNGYGGMPASLDQNSSMPPSTLNLMRDFGQPIDISMPFISSKTFATEIDDKTAKSITDGIALSRSIETTYYVAASTVLSIFAPNAYWGTAWWIGSNGYSVYAAYFANSNYVSPTTYYTTVALYDAHEIDEGLVYVLVRTDSASDSALNTTWWAAGYYTDELNTQQIVNEALWIAN